MKNKNNHEEKMEMHPNKKSLQITSHRAHRTCFGEQEVSLKKAQVEGTCLCRKIGCQR